MANVLLEYLKRIDERNYITGREHRQFLGELEKALDAIWKIRKSNQDEALKFVRDRIINLEDELQHYTMVEDDKAKASFTREDLRLFKNIEQSLIKAQEKNDKDTAFDLISKKNVDIKLLRWAYPMLEAYNGHVREEKDYWWREELTMEEFQFLGRMVGAM